MQIGDGFQEMPQLFQNNPLLILAHMEYPYKLKSQVNHNIRGSCCNFNTLVKTSGSVSLDIQTTMLYQRIIIDHKLKLMHKLEKEAVTKNHKKKS